MNILTGQQFTDKALQESIFTKARELRDADKAGNVPKLLSGKIVATLFFEASTRTRLSFEAGAIKLGAGIISITDPKTSSSSKGETLEDTIRMVSSYADVIVLRHPDAGAAEIAAKVSSVPVINAGDGGNEHPTQALFDLFTIKENLGRLNNLKIVFGFDPLHSRTIHSLSKILATFPNNHFIFISPRDLELSALHMAELESNGATTEVRETMDGVGDADVIYINRLQEERFQNKADFENSRRLFVLKPEYLAGSRAIVLDPLPRIDEIDTAVDALPNAKYFEQAKNGLYVRMALMCYALSS